MADEAVIIELIDGGRPIRYTVANGATIEKGTIGEMSNPRTAVTSTDEGSFVGIAAAEKVINDGSTSLAFYTEGIFDLKTDTSTPGVGTLVVTDGANLVKARDAGDDLLGDCVGKALETAGSGDVIAVAVGIYMS